MIRRDGQWQECDWQTALEFAANGLKAAKEKYGAQSIGALGSPHSTLEELYLLQKLMRGLGSGNVDHRLRQSDFRADTIARRSLAGDEHRGSFPAEVGADYRQHPAQGSPAARAAFAPGGEAGRAIEPDQSGGR